MEFLSRIAGMENITESALDRAIRLYGGITKLARDIPVASHSVINGWRRTRVPAEHAPRIEELTGVLCEELRPGVAWSVLRGKKRRTRQPNTQAQAQA